MRILIAQESRELAEEAAGLLENRGFETEICTDGEEICSLLMTDGFAAAVLDYTLPGLSGPLVLSRLRSAGNLTPVLMLTARAGVPEKVECLNLGAGDYVVRPADRDELAARLYALIRTAERRSSDICRIGDLTVDTEARAAERGGWELELTRREYDLLEYLAVNRGRVLSKEQILNRVWGPDYEGSAEEVEVYMSYLRRKVDDRYNEKLLHTVRGRGYRLGE